LEEHRSPTLGQVRQPRPAALFDRTPAGVHELAPLLGADNASILCEVGYSADDIASLEHDRVLYNVAAR
jgi:crotonobetainyl-CoA:carnitine CoA-transferase CaiB-like acyl-CoA transferase